MNLVDTSGWLEYFANSKNATLFAPAIEKTEDLIVSTINIYEMYKKILIEKDEYTAILVISLMKQAKVIEVNSEIAIQAAKLSFEKKIPMADSLIYVTAKLNNAILWTQDFHFKGLQGVKYFKK